MPVTFNADVTLPLKLKLAPLNVSNASTLPPELRPAVPFTFAPVILPVTLRADITLPVKLKLPALTSAP